MKRVELTFVPPMDRSDGNFPMPPTPASVVAKNTGDAPIHFTIYDPLSKVGGHPLSVLREIVLKPRECVPFHGPQLYHVGIAAGAEPRKGLMRFGRPKDDADA